jgi:hypothetical protein
MPRKFTPHAPEVVRALESIKIEYWTKLPGTIQKEIMPNQKVLRERPISVVFRFIGTDGKEHLVTMHEDMQHEGMDRLRPVLEQLLNYANTLPFNDAIEGSEAFIQDIPAPTTPAPDTPAPTLAK